MRVLWYAALVCTAGWMWSGCVTSKPSVSQDMRSSLVAYARSFVGQPYRAGGDNPKRGFDCSGFVHYVFAHYGLQLPRTSAEQARSGKEVARNEVRAGDIAYFRRSPQGRVFHVAIVVGVRSGEVQMVHATTSRGVVEDALGTAPFWRDQYVGFRNVLGGHLRGSQ